MKINPQTIKKDFPIFTNNPSLVYLDTASTSQTPKMVLDKMDEYYITYRANIHRGLYKSGELASAAYEDAREKVAQFISADTKEIIFTSGATASSNMLISMLEHSILGRAALPRIVTTVMEHHASLIPLQKLAERRGFVLEHIPLKGFNLDYDAAEKLITSKTKIVSVMLASNVTGTINDVAGITKIAHKAGALVICDATSAVGHMPVDVKKLGVDFMYFSGHKMCGPTGVGVLWGKKEILETLEPSVYGGGIVDEVTFERAVWRGVPERFEAGTPNIAGVIGFGRAVDYLQKVDVENIQTHTQTLVQDAIKKLEGISGIRIITEKDITKNIGIVSFIVDGIHAHDVADILGREGVAVRAGHHCAMPFVVALGAQATVRASFYIYSTRTDVDALVAGIKKAKQVFKV